MADIAFFGLGNMGRPMAANLVRAGHGVIAHDPAPGAADAALAAGARFEPEPRLALAGAQVIVSMLPAGPHVAALAREVVIGHAAPGTLWIDCSTIDVETARATAAAAAAAGLAMVDAPVSGGVGGATAATLTFMVGGSDGAVADARPVLEAMGKRIVHTGGAGTGQAAKICNNMMLGIQMISVCEGLALAEKLGLDPAMLYQVSSTASGQCWSLTTYCPWPGPVAGAPSNRGYQPGFAAAMMLKDLQLAAAAATAAGAEIPLGTAAGALYAAFVEGGAGALDFSAILSTFRQGQLPT